MFGGECDSADSVVRWRQRLMRRVYFMERTWHLNQLKSLELRERELRGRELREGELRGGE